MNSDKDNDHEGNGKIFGEIGLSSATFAKNLNQLYNIQSMFNRLDQFTHDIPNAPVNYLRDCWNDIIGNAQDMCTKTTRILTSTECLTPQNVKDVLDEIHQAKVKIASDQISLGTLVAAFIILNQIWKLCEVWDTVTDAENVVNKSRSQINEINKNINQLKTWGIELRDLMNKYEDETNIRIGKRKRKSDQEKKLIKTIKFKISTMKITSDDTRSMISTLKIDVNGKTQALVIYQRDQISNGIINGVHGATNMIQMFQFSNLLSPGLTFLQGLITTVFFGLVAVNRSMYYITGKKLDELREILKQIDQLDEQLRSINHIVHEAEARVAESEKLNKNNFCNKIAKV